jgi:glycosyltransferase involved in cell wall biosynthesis
MAKPLIATDVPGCRALVEHGVNGRLCTVRDAGALAAAMLDVASLPPDERALLGAAGRAKVEAAYSEEKVAQLYLDAIEDALKT